MTNTTPYTEVVSCTDTHKKWPDDSTIDVRGCVEDSPSRLGTDRTTFQVFVVHHGKHEVLFESRKVRSHDSNPSPEAIASEARGYARGYIDGRGGSL